jgi:hypothetical protein
MAQIDLPVLHQSLVTLVGYFGTTGSTGDSQVPFHSSTFVFFRNIHTNIRLSFSLGLIDMCTHAIARCSSCACSIPSLPFTLLGHRLLLLLLPRQQLSPLRCCSS